MVEGNNFFAISPANFKEHDRLLFDPEFQSILKDDEGFVSPLKIHEAEGMQLMLSAENPNDNIDEIGETKILL
jgi:hypothetical protein